MARQQRQFPHGKYILRSQNGSQNYAVYMYYYWKGKQVRHSVDMYVAQKDWNQDANGGVGEFRPSYNPRGRTITIAYLALVDVPIEVKGQNATSTLRDSKKVAKQGKQLRNEYENSRMSIKDYRANISELLYKYKILIKD